MKQSRNTVREHRPSQLNNRLAIPASIGSGNHNSPEERPKFAAARVWRPAAAVQTQQPINQNSGQPPKFAAARVWRPEGAKPKAQQNNAPAAKQRDPVPTLTLSSFRGEELSCADVLVTCHPEGDVTVQAVCVPPEIGSFESYQQKLHRSFWRKERNPASEVPRRKDWAAEQSEPAVDPKVLDGTSVAIWTVYRGNETKAVWFCRRAVSWDGEVGSPEKLTSAMPMIRATYRPALLELLTEFSGLEWAVNAQVKYAEYMTTPIGLYMELEAKYNVDLAALMDLAVDGQDRVETFTEMVQGHAKAGGVSFDEGVPSEVAPRMAIEMVTPESLEAIRAQMPSAEEIERDGMIFLRPEEAEAVA